MVDPVMAMFAAFVSFIVGVCVGVVASRGDNEI